MLLQFNDNNSKAYGNAKLIRKTKVFNFRYEQLDNGRSYRFNDPMYGYMNVKASMSIKTKDELNFVNGDVIELDTLGIKLRIANITKKVNMPQLQFLKSDYSVEYILDLE